MVSVAQRPLTFLHSAPYFAGLLVVALIAFWPSYLSQVTRAGVYTHLHALTATIWIGLLIAQPAAIRARRLALHRTIGRLSYVIAPIVVITMVLLAHRNTSRPEIPEFDRAGVYVPLSLAALFAVSYAMAILTRRTMVLHARFMVCTALTLIDPVGVRLLFWAFPNATWRYQWPTFVLTDLVFLWLIWRERHMRTGRAVFPAMLALFVAAQAAFVFDWFLHPAWVSFVRWFLSLPLT